MNLATHFDRSMNFVRYSRKRTRLTFARSEKFKKFMVHLYGWRYGSELWKAGRNRLMVQNDLEMCN